MMTAPFFCSQSWKADWQLLPEAAMIRVIPNLSSTTPQIFLNPKALECGIHLIILATIKKVSYRSCDNHPKAIMNSTFIRDCPTIHVMKVFMDINCGLNYQTVG